MALFDTPGSAAVQTFVQEMENAGDETEAAILEQDAVAGAEMFLIAFQRGVAQSTDR